MEFWGVEVKNGESLKVNPGDEHIIHLSKACLGEVKKDKGNEPVSLYVNIGDQKLQIGTLSAEKFPQTSYDLVFEKEFELSHNWKYGSVFLTGYKVPSQMESDDDDDEDSDDFDEEDIPVVPANGKPESEVKSDAKHGVNEANQNKTSNPKKKEKDNEKEANGEGEEDSSESDDDSSEDEVESSEDDDDSDEDDDDDSDDEETPKKTEGSNKRLHGSSKKTPVPVKKPKFITPVKDEKPGSSKNGGHVDTPYPKASKPAANNKNPAKQPTPKSNGDYSCKPCNRSFKTEDALGSHNKAKHSAK